MLTTEGPQTELDRYGPPRSYFEGLTLPALAKWKGSVVRRVGHIDDIVFPFLKTIDATPATKSDSELTDKELLQKVLADNAALKQQVATLTAK